MLLAAAHLTPDVMLTASHQDPASRPLTLTLMDRDVNTDHYMLHYDVNTGSVDMKWWICLLCQDGLFDTVTGMNIRSIANGNESKEVGVIDKADTDWVADTTEEETEIRTQE